MAENIIGIYFQDELPIEGAELHPSDDSFDPGTELDADIARNGYFGSRPEDS